MSQKEASSIPSETWFYDSELRAGDAVNVIMNVRLYPEHMWYDSIQDDDTWIISTPILEVNDKCVLVDVMNNKKDDANDNRVLAALVITHLGIGCVMLERKYFSKV
jgi:hypothetical protein